MWAHNNKSKYEIQNCIQFIHLYLSWVNRNFQLVLNEMGPGGTSRAWYFHSPGWLILFLVLFHICLAGPCLALWFKINAYIFRDTRRADAAQRRADKKHDRQMARRGINVWVNGTHVKSHKRDNKVKEIFRILNTQSQR